MSVRGGEDAIGQSEAFLEFQDKIARVAPVDRPVLLIGERGTGKELGAKRLHFLSKRWQGPLVTLNCSSLSSGVIESELFGHDKGAFTGAVHDRKGRFELADGGTLFLDELATIPLEVQEKILRVVEYGVFERVGGDRQIEVDVRVVGATNVDLRDSVKEGKFKADLLDRLSFEVLTLPPLRFRQDDIMLLADHFSGHISYELDRDNPPTFSKRVCDELLNHPWEGNIRELKNVVERASYKCEGDLIDHLVFDPFSSPYQVSVVVEPSQREANTSSSKSAKDIEMVEEDVVTKPFKQAVKEFEIKMISGALQRAKYNQRLAAKELELSYDQFRGLHKKYKSIL